MSLRTCGLRVDCSFLIRDRAYTDQSSLSMDEPQPQQALQPEPIQPPPPTVVASPEPPPVPPRSSFFISTGFIVGLIGLLVVVLMGVGVTYAFVAKIGPFAKLPYGEDNLISGLLNASRAINSSSYALVGSIAVEPRDADAQPFALEASNQEVLRQQYARDYQRSQDISTLLNQMRTLSVYPARLNDVVTAITKKNAGNKYYKANFSLMDPETNAQYLYRSTENGQNFELSVTFETEAAISTIRKNSALMSNDSEARIQGQTVVFNKNSYGSLYLSREPQKPWLVQASEMARFLPAELKAQMSVLASANWDTSSSDWTFIADASGDFGDLTYKFNFEVLKKDKYFYFRINNIPSLFLSYIAVAKGEWIKIDPTDTASLGEYSALGNFATSLPESEERYKKARAVFAHLLQKAAQFADEEHLLAFKSTPESVKVDGRSLYKYEVEIRKDAILTFYKRLAAEASLNRETSSPVLFNDQGMIEYLESDEFDQVFDFYKKNTTLTIYVDPTGYPAILEQSSRLVPPDTATQLAGKQLRTKFKLVLDDINETVTVEEPKGAKELKDVIEASKANQAGSLELAREKGANAAIKAKMIGARAEAEIYYDSNKNSYAGVCGAASVGGATSIYATILTAAKSAGLSTVNTSIVTSGSIKLATCHATASGYAAEVPLSNGKTYCIDSKGTAKEEITFGILANSTACR